MQLVSTLPRFTRVKQVAFTQNRMFVLSKDGYVYMYKIDEKLPSRTELALNSTLSKAVGSQITGEVKVSEAPIHIADLPSIKQIACGLDHALFLTGDGQVMAMGDDTFG